MITKGQKGTLSGALGIVEGQAPVGDHAGAYDG